jgi:hypothetical protein
MKHLIKMAVGGALALASAGAFAQAPILPSTGDGQVTLTLLSKDDATPFSYAYNLGITMSQLSTLPTAAGSTKSWSLTGLATDLSGFSGTSNLVFDVTASGQTGSIAKAGSFTLASTFDPVTAPPSVVAGTTSGALSQAEQANNAWLTNWVGTANNEFTNNTSATNYANAVYNAALETFPYNAAASTSTALPFYELVSNKSTTSTVQTPTTFAGLFTIDLSTDMLTYTVPGSSPVPLPAGVWLLLSGLASLGVLGRRRNDVNGAVAA